MSHENVDTTSVMQQLRARSNMPDELVEVFAAEAEEHLRQIYDGLDRLRTELSDRNALADVRRSAHTLKGAAGAVGLEAVTRLAHRMEDLLDHLFDHQLGLDQRQIELLLRTADQLQDLTADQIDFDQNFAQAAENLLDLYKQYDIQMTNLEVGSFSAHGPGGTSFDSNCSNPVGSESDDQQSDRVSAEDMATLPAVAVETIQEQLRSNINIDPELAEIFRGELNEHLIALNAGLEQLRNDRGNLAALGDIRRTSHTLKGAAGAVGLESVGGLMRCLEHLLEALSEHRQSVTEDQLHLLSTTVNCVQTLTNGNFDLDQTATAIRDIYCDYANAMTVVGKHGTDVTPFAGVQPSQDAASANVTAATKTPSGGPNSTANSTAQYLRVPLERLDGLVSIIGEMVVNRSAFHQRLADFEARIQDMQASVGRFRSVAQDVETRYSVDALKVGIRRPHVADRRGMSAMNAVNDSHAELDSLEFDRYNDFHLLARSLSEATNDVTVITNELRNLYGDFETLLGRQQRFNRDAQDSLIHIRMVPVENIVNRIERTVRSVSNKLGKKVELIVRGSSTELDKSVLEEIIDPLLHLIRNGIDHGIETKDERLAAGKPESATLTVEALNQGTQVTIRVVDDGRGIELDKVRNKAIELGLVAQDQILTNEDLHSLIFLPGFSTASSLSEISGRGVGMDVVREAVQRLKGTIGVDSQTGIGSTFTIHLPMTLAVTRALLVDASGHRFAIPMQCIQQIMRFDPAAVVRVGSQPIFNFGDQMLPLKDLSVHMQLKPEERFSFTQTSPMLLVRSGDSQVAITVDDIAGGQDIVVKSFGDHLFAIPGYLGATVAGDGTVIPIIDPSDLCGQKSVVTATGNLNHHPSKTNIRRKTAMVIDDSLSVRRVTANLLRSHGWDVLDAKDGIDALEKLSAVDTPPDVFLCDMEMPRMDGLELISRIRGQREFATTPILMVTSRAGDKHRRLAVEAGANEHVVKPFNDEQLMSLINQIVNEHRELAAS